MPQFKSRDQFLKEFESQKGLAIDRYFAARDNDPSLDSCRASLATHLEAYRTAKADEDFNEMQNIMGDATEGSLLWLLQTCGPCLADVAQVNGGAAVYESNGWCRLPKADPTELKASLGKARDFLVKLDSYPQDKGGFNYIIAFSGTNANGQLTPGVVLKPTPAVTTAFVAVRSLANSSFGYFGDCTFKDSLAADPIPSFVLQFVTSNQPFKAPKSIFDPQANKKISLFALSSVRGEWFVDAVGNMHYFTTGDFGTLGSLAGGFFDLNLYARKVLMDTLLDLFEVVTRKVGDKT